MAFFQCNIFSQTLHFNTNIGVIIPSPNSDEIFNQTDSGYFEPGIKYQTVYLFHGLFGDFSDWMRWTSIERYAQERKVAIIMPSTSNSFYQNMYRGEKYFTYLTEELPHFVHTIFPLSNAREDNFTVGLSMGGYGALKIALTKPEEYACAASLSGAVDIVEVIENGLFQDTFIDISNIFEYPEYLENTDADLFTLIRKLIKENRTVPKIFISCGKEDFMYQQHERSKRKLTEIGVEFHFEEHPGKHDWNYWDTHVQTALDWLPLKRTVIKPG